MQNTLPPIIINANGNTFQYSYDDAGNRLTMPETQIQSQSGQSFNLSRFGSYDLDKKNKSRADITLNISSPQGHPFFEIPMQGGVILTPVSS